MKRGNLIIINGASSSGKTSTCRVLQDLFEHLYVLLGIDVFSQIIPPKQNNMQTIEPEYFTAKPYMKNDLEYFQITTGPLLDDVIFTSYKAIAEYLDAGINVISDQLFWSPKWFRQALDILHPYNVFFCGLLVSENEGARREKMRSTGDVNDILEGGRVGGWGRTSAEITHHNMIYDFKIDNSSLSLEQTALQIKEAYEKTMHPSAFKTLYKTYVSEIT